MRIIIAGFVTAAIGFAMAVPTALEARGAAEDAAQLEATWDGLDPADPANQSMLYR
jgi:hypothetical protein